MTVCVIAQRTTRIIDRTFASRCRLWHRTHDVNGVNRLDTNRKTTAHVRTHITTDLDKVSRVRAHTTRVEIEGVCVLRHQFSTAILQKQTRCTVADVHRNLRIFDTIRRRRTTDSDPIVQIVANHCGGRKFEPNVLKGALTIEADWV